MSLQINEYTKTRIKATSKPDDLMDIDSTEDSGSSFESAKMKVSEFIGYVESQLPPITMYVIDGIISANRTITAFGRWTKWKGGDVVVEMANPFNDYGFAVNDFTSAEKARLGFDQATSSGVLEVKNSTGTFLNANDGKLGVGTVTPISKVNIKSDGTGNGKALQVEDSTGSEIVRVLDNKEILFGSENGTDRANVEIYAGTAPEIRCYLNGATTNYASLTYSRSTIGAAKIRATGNDQINYTLDVIGQTNTASNVTQIYVKNRIPQLQDSSNASSDIRMAGNLSLGQAVGSNLETINTNRLSLKAGLRATITDYNPSTDAFKTLGIDSKGWMLNVDGGTNYDTQTAPSGTVPSYNVNRLGVQSIEAINGVIASEVTYTDAATLRIDGAPTSVSNKSVITNSYALDVADGLSKFGGDIKIVDRLDGVILKDRINANNYRIYTENGVLKTEIA